MSEPVARDKLLRHLLIGLALALVIYFGAFAVLEHSRQRKGGWQVEFASNGSGTPSLAVSQPFLGLSNISFVFPDQHVARTNLAETIIFDRPITNVPFGKVVYLDTTFLPGAIAFDMFGHEIQLLPRVLLLEHREVPWKSGSVFRIEATNRTHFIR